ncbi:MAG: hypothetical protein NT105_12365 [Verrucomicrobia bacterium]|nr:hypothetical protein [Verrucomicrobiota bacterium]
MEIRKYPKGERQVWNYHWVAYNDTKGSSYAITDAYYQEGWHSTKEVTEKDGSKENYIWEGNHWKFVSRTRAPSKTSSVEQAPKTTQTAWSGPYFGGQIVKSNGRVVTTERSAGTGLNTNQFADNHDPFGGGINGGYDWLPCHNKFLVGVGFDADFPDEDVQHSFATGAYLKSTVDFAGLVQARAGYLVMQNLLLYALTGVSVADQHIQMNLGGATTDEDKFTPGFTAGAGVEWMITTAQTGGPVGFLRAPSIFVEYAHTWWADAELNQPAASPAFNYSWTRESDMIRARFPRAVLMDLLRGRV